MTTTLGIADLVSAIIWPLALVILFLVYRTYLGTWVTDILPRINKFGLGALSPELAPLARASSLVPCLTQTSKPAQGLRRDPAAQKGQPS